MTFNTEQIAQLSAKLDASNVKGRKVAGRQVSYIEGWHAIAEANRIFGFSEWDREAVEIKCVSEAPREIGEQKKPGFGVGYICRVRITVRAGERAIVREGCGYGSGIDQDLGSAHESAIKEAETDAMKRALMTFGNPFGLALYDKTQENVERASPPPPPARTAPPPAAKPQAADESAHKPVFEIGKEALLMTKTLKEYNAWIDDNGAMLAQLEKAAPKLFAELCSIGEAHLRGLQAKSPPIRMAG